MGHPAAYSFPMMVGHYANSQQCFPGDGCLGGRHRRLRPVAVDQLDLSRYPDFPPAVQEMISDVPIASVTRPEDRDLERFAGRVRDVTG
jgi:hypothetical protein